MNGTNNTAVRLAALTRSAELVRSNKIGPLVERFNRAEDPEEVDSAAAELLAGVTIADAAYRRSMELAVLHMSSDVAGDRIMLEEVPA